MRKQILKAIILTGFTVGLLDISAAFLNYFIVTGKNPMRVLEFIASGVFGKEAFNGNSFMVLYGLIFHFCIALLWTVLFFFFYPKIALVRNNWIASGIGYAFIVWCAMTRIVLPLSNVSQQPFDISKALLAIAILILCIGLPISYSVKKYIHR